MRSPILLDIGHSIDDFFSVALAACSPELDLLGVTTVADGRGIRAVITRLLLDAYGRSDVPVAYGEGIGPFDALYASWAQRSAAFRRPKRRRHSDFPRALEFMRSVLLERGPLSLVVIGPLTNVAALLRRWPELARRIKHIYFTGGWVTQALPEHNVRLDPESALAVLEHDVPCTAFGCEVTRGFRLLSPHQAQLASATCPGATILHALYTEWCRFRGVQSPELHDPMLITYLCGAADAKLEEAQVTVATSGPGRGTMYRVKEGGRTIRVATAIDAPRYIDFLLERLAPPPTAAAPATSPSSWSVEVRAAYHLRHYPTWSLNNVMHGSHILALVQAGGGQAQVNQLSFALEPGCAVYLAPGEVLSVSSPAGLDAYWIYFDVYARQPGGQVPLARLPWPNYFAPVPETDLWLSLARRVEAYWVHPAPESAFMCQAAFLEILANLCTRSREQALQPRRPVFETAEQAKRWLEARITEAVTLDELTKHVAVSKYHLVHAFRQVFGVPPLQYHRKLRLEHARRLLRLRHLSVSEVAERVGYHSTTAFTRAYKREFGITPIEEQTSLTPSP